MSEQYIAEFRNFSKEEIEEMVRAQYGNFIFEDQGNGALVCYPTAKGQVTIRPLFQAAKERVYLEKARAVAQLRKDRKIRMSIYKVIRELENIIDLRLSNSEGEEG